MSIIKIKDPIKVIREGTLAIENDCETMETLVECLKYCFPEDDAEIAVKLSKDHYRFFYACPHCDGEWVCDDPIDLPTITASELLKHIEGDVDCKESRNWRRTEKYKADLSGDTVINFNYSDPTLEQLQQRIEIIGEQQLDLMHWIEQLENKLEENNCCNKKCKK